MLTSSSSVRSSRSHSPTCTPGSDYGVLPIVHEGLVERGLLPAEHLVDAG
ncbi:hypothetical protein [Microbispora sp. KK1-11]|nr:hypothetical protein [Microbispora sp. KK1-11]